MNYSGISKLEKVEIKPVWRGDFPDNAEKIKVKSE
jgi:hypothetical protein